jgi:hypothetical protein
MKSRTSSHVTFSTGHSAHPPNRLGFVPMTRFHCACVTSVAPSQNARVIVT